MASGPHPVTGWLRPKQPPHLSPAQVRAAYDEGKALDPEQSLTDDAVYAQYEQQRILGNVGSDFPVPHTKPAPYMPEPSPPPSKQTRGQVIVETMSSTKDHFQNVDNPETQDRQRAKQFDAAAKRRTDELATVGAGDLMEAIKVAQSISEAEDASLREQQSR
jgi:hypothetical protein